VLVDATNSVGTTGMWLNGRRFDEVFHQDDGRRASVIF